MSSSLRAWAMRVLDYGEGRLVGKVKRGRQGKGNEAYIIEHFISHL